MRARLLFGCQGWNHPEWVGSFYNGQAGVADMLGAYATEFDTVEIDDTFRGIPPVSLVEVWKESVPDGFLFAARVPQYVTHEQRFVESGSFLTRFVKRVSMLGDLLGPLLMTVPPGLACTAETIDIFSRFVADLPKGFRWAAELRRADWLCPEVIDSMRQRGVSLVLPEARWLKRTRVTELARQPTADFAYLRWTEPSRRNSDRPDGAWIEEGAESAWSDAVRALAGQVDTVYGYFGNRLSGHAPDDVRRFRQLLGRSASESPV
jgi:uncharacterized protein YecE (DUF72 family)